MSSRTFDLVAEARPASAYNSTNSPILRLPAEIREQIWAFCLKNKYIVVIEGDSPREDDYGARGRRHHLEHIVYETLPSESKIDHSMSIEAIAHHTLPRLWRTCRQVYKETSHLLFHKSNTFCFWNHNDLAVFAISQPLAARQVRRIYLLGLFGALGDQSVKLVSYGRVVTYNKDIVHDAAAEESKIVDILVDAGWDGSPSRLGQDMGVLAYNSLEEVLIGTHMGVLVRKEAEVVNDAEEHDLLSYVRNKLIPYEEKRIAQAQGAWQEIGIRVMLIDRFALGTGSADGRP